MKCKLSILLTLFFSLNGMDAPQESSETVPVKLQDIHTKEYRKFHRYHLENSEPFLAIMRKAFNYDGNKEKYLKNVQALASALLAQHQAMNFLGEASYYAELFLKQKDLFHRIAKQMNATIQDDTIVYEPETPEQLNIVLAHADLVRNIETLSEQELAIVFSWILDASKGKWLNNLGLLRKNTHEGALLENKRVEIQDKMEKSILPEPGSPFISPISEQLIKENVPYVSNFLQGNLKLVVLEEKGASANTLESANREYTQNNIQTAQLYRIHQKEYQKLYEIVLKELKHVYQEATIAKQKISPVILFPIPEQLRKQNHIPAKFPEKLDDIKNPATYLTPFSLDNELEKARAEWEKSQTQAPAKIKYVKRRKKITPITAEATSEKETSEPAAPAPIKIRTAADDSYIAEGAEDDIQIIIEDPKNDATITLFKTKINPANAARLKNLPRKDYTPNVQQWFDNPKKARVDQGHTDPNSPKHRAGEPEWKPIVLHAFSRLVDDYLYQYGTVGEINSRSEKDKKDILITVPGKLEYPNGDEETGVFAYIIDSKNGKWYHRMFTPHASKNLISDLFAKGYFAPDMTGYYDVFFPALPKK
jgi:hypothetical protein